MKPIAPRDSLAQRVYESIVDEICAGALTEGAHLVQEQLAERLGVSRQPVQQAMARLKAEGLLEEAGRRGLAVTPLDMKAMRHHYDIRAALDGLAARLAAARAGSDSGAAETLARKGLVILERGAGAVASGATAEQVRFDMEFHGLIYAASGNPLLAGAAEPHWRFLRRAMGAILRYGTLPGEIWRQHGEILHAVVSGEPALAERLAVDHDIEAARTLREALSARDAA